MTDAVEKTTYLLEMKDGQKKKVTVPTSWKVTFGPVAPGSKEAGYNGHSGLCLRFYEGADAGKGKQHAVFVGVESFRDTSIEILEEVVETKRETLVRQGDESGEALVVEATAKTWVNPDAPRSKESAFGGPAGTPAGSRLLVVQR